jgi:hypothetical protein
MHHGDLPGMQQMLYATRLTQRVDCGVLKEPELILGVRSAGIRECPHGLPGPTIVLQARQSADQQRALSAHRAQTSDS